MLLGTGVVALLAIPGALLLPADFGGLVGFVLVSAWVNGPLGVFLPATFEPILMLFGEIYPPLLVAALGMVGMLYIEYLNYHLYSKLLHSEMLRVLRESRAVARALGIFERAPFFTIWLHSWSPLPYWVMRVLAPISRYPPRKYLLATFLGRFPRLWFFAALGAWLHPGVRILAAVSVGSILLALGVFAVQRRVHPAAPAGTPTPSP